MIENSDGNAGLVWVSYAAKSNKDDVDSLPSQHKQNYEWAAGRGEQVVASFQDEASGFKGSRGPGLQRAKDHCERLAADGVPVGLVVAVSDRLARGDGRAAAHLVEHVLWARQHNIEIKSSSGENLDDIVYAALLGERAYQDSAAKSAHVRRGKLAKAEEGRHNGGPRKFGYRYAPYLGEDGKRRSQLEIVAEEAEALCLIRDWTFDGRSQSWIARTLNERGYKTVRGAQWTQTRVNQMVHNKLYCGYRKSGDGYIKSNSIPPIWSEDDFYAMQNALKARRRGIGRGGRPVIGHHLLTHGLGRCSCGAALKPRTDRKGYGQYEVYLCDGRISGSTVCTVSAIPRGPIDDAIWDYVGAVAVDLDRLADEWRLLTESRLAAVRAQIIQAELELDSARARFSRVKRDYQNDDLDVDDWNDQRPELLDEIKACQDAVDVLHHSRDLVTADNDTVELRAEVERRLHRVRDAISGLRAGGHLEAARAELWRLFECFVVHAPGSPSEPDLFRGDLAVAGYIIEPRVRPEMVETPLTVLDSGDAVPESLSGIGGQLIASEP